MPTHTQFKGVENCGDSLLSDQLETNVMSFFQWGSLGIGAFYNVTIPSTGSFGGNQHQLRVRDNPYYTKGQLWEGFRSNWVWETGVEYDYQPIRVSGIFVNSTYYPISTTGTYAYHINYPLGQVLFDSAISPTSLVTCNYSYRHYNWSTSDVEWWRQLQQGSFRVDNPHYSQYGSGIYSLFSEQRIQMPHVIVEAQPSTSRYPKEIGSSAAVVNQDVVFHILSETRWDSKQLHDIITYQWEKRFIAFDKNLMYESGRFPLDEYGSPNSGAIMYTDLVKSTIEGGCGWKQLRFSEMRSNGLTSDNSAPVYYASVKAKVELDLP